jgi:hypothetical protein
MGKALVIKNASFGKNALTTVNFEEGTQCTGIVLSADTASLGAIGDTVKLTATLTPANTTDSVVWTTSDRTIATVADGVITASGVGTATITATCGLASATCEVTCVNTLDYMYVLSEYNHKSEQTDADYVYRESGSAAYAAIQSDAATPKRIRGGENEGLLLYPILLGAGAKTVTITAPSTVRVTAWFCDSKTACDYSLTHSGYDMYAKLISGDSSAYDASVALGDRTLTVPDGADSIACSVQYPNGTVTEEIMVQIKMVVS